jgi:hypothetical protein
MWILLIIAVSGGVVYGKAAIHNSIYELPMMNENFCNTARRKILELKVENTQITAVCLKKAD